MIRALLFLSFVGMVLAANLTTAHLGLVAAGLGPLVLLVPPGTYFAGITFGLRDGLQDRGGVRLVLPAIAAGAVLSFVLTEPGLAVASGAAFLLAELADLLVYTPLRDKGWRRAVIASNAVGAVVDTLLFLWLAGFELTPESIGGQLLVKAVLMTALYVGIKQAWLRYGGRRRALFGQRVQPEGA
jgi:queuosine precursor transporter